MPSSHQCGWNVKSELSTTCPLFCTHSIDFFAFIPLKLILLISVLSFQSLKIYLSSDSVIHDIDRTLHLCIIHKFDNVFFYLFLSRLDKIIEMDRTLCYLVTKIYFQVYSCFLISTVIQQLWNLLITQFFNLSFFNFIHI